MVITLLAGVAIGVTSTLGVQQSAWWERRQDIERHTQWVENVLSGSILRRVVVTDHDDKPPAGVSVMDLPNGSAVAELVRAELLRSMAPGYGRMKPLGPDFTVRIEVEHPDLGAPAVVLHLDPHGELLPKPEHRIGWLCGVSQRAHSLLTLIAFLGRRQRGIPVEQAHLAEASAEDAIGWLTRILPPLSSPGETATQDALIAEVRKHLSAAPTAKPGTAGR